MVFKIQEFFELLEEEPGLNRHLLHTMAERSQRLYKEADLVRFIWVRPWSTDIDIHKIIYRMIPFWEVYGKCKILTEEEWKINPDVTSKSYRKTLSSNFRFVFLLGDSDDQQWKKYCLSESNMQICFAKPEENFLGLKQSEREFDSSHMELILLHNNRDRPPQNTAKWLKTASFEMHYHIVPESAEDMNRLVRCLTGNAIGLVCTGGGARGIAHLGIIHSFKENRIPIDYLVGTSAGALFTVGFNMNMRLTEQLHFVEEINKNSKKINDYTFPFLSLLGGKYFHKIIEEYALDWQIEDLWIPFACVSASLSDGQVYVHRNGSLSQALKATSAIPGLLPPVAHNGKLLVDGGVLNNAPTDVTKFFPKGKVVLCDISLQKVMNLKGNYPTTTSGWKMFFSSLNPFNKNSLQFALPAILLRSFEMAADAIHSEKIKTHPPYLYINPPMEGIRTLDYDSVKLGYEKGFEFGMQNGKEWLKALDISEF